MARRGKWKYSDYQRKVIFPELGDSSAPAKDAPPPPPPQQQQQQQQAQKPPQQQAQAPAALPPIPDDLLGVQAYVLWEHAGKPDGADFSGDARRLVAFNASVFPGD